MPSKHYVYGGSTASIWMECDAAMQLSRMCPQKEAGDAAKRGTRIHEIAEKIFIGTYNGEKNDEYDEAFVYINDVKALFWEPHIENTIEVRHDVGGSIDGWALQDRTLYVWDLKTGAKKVVVENNKQLLFYAMLVIHEISALHPTTLLIDHVRLGIHQGGQFKWWNLTVDDAVDKITFMSRRLYNLGNDSLTFNDGTHCFFCKAQPMCPKKVAQNRMVELTPAPRF